MTLNRDAEKAAFEPGDEIDHGRLFDFTGYRIKLAYSLVFQTFNEMFSELNLAFGQYSVLVLIGLNPGLSQLALANAAGLDGSTIVPITNRFARLGWIRRVRRQDDRRVYAVRITPAGQTILDKAARLIEAHDRQLLAPFTERERTTLMNLLGRIVNNPQATRSKLGRGVLQRTRAEAARTKTAKKSTSRGSPRLAASG
jgi:DNA-binding MarR family transcriptional regulator